MSLAINIVQIDQLDPTGVSGTTAVLAKTAMMGLDWPVSWVPFAIRPERQPRGPL